MTSETAQAELGSTEHGDEPEPLGAPGESTSERLLHAAAKLFREKGYSSTSTRELAGVLGIQKASLYHHIEKKEDLLYRLCLDALNRMHREVERATSGCYDPIDRLQALICAHLACALADQDEHATMVFELRKLSGERKATVIGLRDGYETLVRETIEDGQEKGAIRRDIPAKYLSLGLLNLLNRSIFWFRTGGPLTPEELSDMLASIFLNGAAEVGTNEGQRHPKR
jgi:TetR/AcrR family transcriptional regulator, cholesterol catabolism regulator